MGQELELGLKFELADHVARGVSHDISNLLTAILGHTSLVRSALAPDHAAVNSLAEIERAAQLAAGASRAMLAFSRQGPAERRLVEVGPLVESAGRLIRAMLPARVGVRIDSPPDGLRVWGEDAQLHLALLNLAFWARYELARGGEFVLVVEDCAPNERSNSGRGVWLRLTLRRPGDGAPQLATGEDHRDEAHARVGLARKTVESIVHAHGGTIAWALPAAREPDVSIWLPAADAGGQDVELRRATGELILIAEDHELTRGLMVSALIAHGFDVLPAANGAELLSLLEANRQRTRLLLLDADLPRRGEPECLREIRASGPKFRTILMTGNGQTELNGWCDSDTLLLHKPFPMAALAGMVTQALRDPHTSTGARR